MTTTTITPTSRAQASLAALTTRMPRIGLDELNQVARLQTRVDTKYLITPEQMVAVLDQIGDRLRVLEIDGHRSFGYESVYFDTESLQTFHDHRQGRRLRFKVRTRLYENSGECRLEVKVKSGRGGTVKRRMKYPADQRLALNASGHEFVTKTLREEHGSDAPPLMRALVGEYRRTTFVDPTEHTRITCDTDLRWSRSDHTVIGPDRVLVETKSETGASHIDKALRGLGIRPIKISKYAIGTALLHPHLPANPWNRVLRSAFGWRREARPARA